MRTRTLLDLWSSGETQPGHCAQYAKSSILDLNKSRILVIAAWGPLEHLCPTKALVATELVKTT
jgi:hypothetical protein